MIIIFCAQPSSIPFPSISCFLLFIDEGVLVLTMDLICLTFAQSCLVIIFFSVSSPTKSAKVDLLLLEDGVRDTRRDYTSHLFCSPLHASTILYYSFVEPKRSISDLGCHSNNYKYGPFSSFLLLPQ